MKILSSPLLTVQPFFRVCMAFFVMAFFFPGFAAAEDPSPLQSIDELRAKVQTLEQEAASLEEQSQGLRHMLWELENDEIYLVVDTEANRLTMRQGDRILRTAVVGTGSRHFIQEETGRNWLFESPTGSLAVLGRERNPVWIRPDWSYVEENMPVPAENDPDRLVRGVLGKYALILGNGYKIHGTTYKNLLGTHFTHGCISVGDEDLEVIYRTVKTGTKVYIY